jgi:hypothetical protein
MSGIERYRGVVPRPRSKTACKGIQSNLWINRPFPLKDTRFPRRFVPKTEVATIVMNKSFFNEKTWQCPFASVKDSHKEFIEKTHVWRIRRCNSVVEVSLEKVEGVENWVGVPNVSQKGWDAADGVQSPTHL